MNTKIKHSGKQQLKKTTKKQLNIKPHSGKLQKRGKTK